MSEVARVESWFREGRIVRPLRGACTVDLARAIAAVVGAPAPDGEHVRDIARRIGETEHLIFVIADGFGMHLMDYLPEASLLRSRCEQSIDAVFPSSTAPALTSVATGQWPATHGLLFWYQYLRGPALSVTTLPFIERFSRQSLTELGLGTDALVSRPPQIAAFPRDVLSLQPSITAGSIYTRYYTAGTPVHGYESLASAVNTISARITKADGPTYTYLYFSEIDRVQHEHGPDSAQARDALLRFDADVARLADAVQGRARIVISADHGQFRVEGDAVRYIEEDDELLEMLLCVPTGEGPAPAFHVHPGREQDFEVAFRRRFGGEFALLVAAEAEALRLLGPEALDDRARSVLGDYLALTAEPVVLRFRPRSGAMPGDHGGLLRAEMEVPLIVI